MHASGRGLASVLKESTGQLGDKTNTPDWGIKSPERRDTKKRGGLESRAEGYEEWSQEAVFS